MTNLLQETKDAIETSGHKETDIVFIGSEKSGHQCTWDEFCKIANVEYYSGFGAAEVAKDLIVVFGDGQKLWRDEYDGSEWWNYSTPFQRPEKALPIRSVICPASQIGWVDLAECNEESDNN
jgi:hypothetical protein